MAKQPQLETLVRTELARAITECEVPDDVVGVVTDRLVALSSVEAIRKFYICSHGICIDYRLDTPRLPELLARLLEMDVRIQKFEGFPEGTLPFWEDLTQLHVEVEVEELAGKVR
jgi:hypothetical protein